MSRSSGFRIAYLAQFSPKKLGTGENRMALLSRRAHERGHELTLFCHDPVHPELAATFERFGTRREELHKLAARPGAARRRLARDFDVIQLNAVAPRERLALAAYAALPARVLFVDHISGPPGEPYPRRSLPHRLLDRATVPRIWQWAGVSEYVRRRAELRFGLPRERTCVMYGGVDVERFQPAPESSPVIGPLRIATVAALIAHKGVDVLLQAAARWSIADWRLRIVGDGPDRGRLEALAGELGLGERVAFLGLQDHVDEVLRDTDIFVHPAVWQEALGYTILEGMASGCAVIASRVGGIPELITGPEQGSLLEPGDPDSLASEIERLAGDPELRSEMGKRARERVCDHFTLERNVERTLDWFEAAARGELLSVEGL